MRWLSGDLYRDLWTTPIHVPVLDLKSYAGGLTPTKTGGGMQTKTLQFDAADGREFVFRNVDKTASGAPPEVRKSPLNGFFQDQVSAMHPAAAELAAPIVEAAGILHPVAQIVVMPDDSTLGQFRTEFAGRLGMIEELPKSPKEGTGFGGATKIIESPELLHELETNPKDHVDARTFLAARLTDFLINDTIAAHTSGSGPASRASRSTSGDRSPETATTPSCRTTVSLTQSAGEFAPASSSSTAPSACRG